MQLPVYLDNNATTPCDPRVLDEMIPFFTGHFGNPASRFHLFGWEAQNAVDQARFFIAQLVGARPEEIVFTSGATESCNLAMKGAYENCLFPEPHMIVYKTEHKAVLETARALEKMGCRISLLDVNKDGMPDLEELEQSITPSTFLIAAMVANNETGVIQPVQRISSIAKSHGVRFFTDATQAVGKIPVNVETDGVDLMAFSAHKMYGPKGIGALYVRNRNPKIRLAAQIQGGFQERGMRSGTLNVTGIVGFGKAAMIAQLEMDAEIKKLTGQRDMLEKSLLSLPGMHLNGDPVNRLPHVINISMEDLESERLLLHVSNQLALSPGSACSSAAHEPSHVLKAMGIRKDLLAGSFRISLGRFTTHEMIDFTISVLTSGIEILRRNQILPANNRLQPSSFSALPE